MTAIVVLLVVCISALTFYAGRRFERLRTVDYRKRWKEALATSDRLMQELDLPKEERRSPPEKGRFENVDELVNISDVRRRQIRSMASWDRAELEVERARKGLPPADDLEGMASWDIQEVLRARMKYNE